MKTTLPNHPDPCTEAGEQVFHRVSIRVQHLFVGHRTRLGAVGIAILGIVGVLFLRPPPGRIDSTGAVHSPDPGVSIGLAASGCGPLRPFLASTLSRGQSIIDAYGQLTDTMITEDRTPYRQMTLTRVRTLSGPVQPITMSGWLKAPPQPVLSPPSAAGMWGPDGHLVAVVSPSATTKTATGPLLSIAPIVDNAVILNAASCWSDPSLPTVPYDGPLQEIPGSNSYTYAKLRGGLGAYPLQSFENLLPR